MITFRPDKVMDAAMTHVNGRKHEHGVFCDCQPVIHWDEDRELLVIDHQMFEED